MIYGKFNISEAIIFPFGTNHNAVSIESHSDFYLLTSSFNTNYTAIFSVFRGVFVLFET